MAGKNVGVPSLDEAYLGAMDKALEAHEQSLYDEIPVVCLDDKLDELRMAVG